MATPAIQNRAWVLLLLWGISSIILGFFLIRQPGMTAILLVQFMAVFWVIGGVIDLMSGLTHSDQPHRGWRIFGAVIGIAAGMVMIANPLLGTMVTIAFGYFMLAFTAILNGIINIIGATRAGLSWGGSLLGVAQVIIGIFLATHPMVGMLAYVPTLGILAIVGGIVIIIASFKVKGGGVAAAAA